MKLSSDSRTHTAAQTRTCINNNKVLKSTELLCSLFKKTSICVSNVVRASQLPARIHGYSVLQALPASVVGAVQGPASFHFLSSLLSIV